MPIPLDLHDDVSKWQQNQNDISFIELQSRMQPTAMSIWCENMANKLTLEFKESYIADKQREDFIGYSTIACRRIRWSNLPSISTTTTTTIKLNSNSIVQMLSIFYLSKMSIQGWIRHSSREEYHPPEMTFKIERLLNSIASRTHYRFRIHHNYIGSKTKVKNWLFGYEFCQTVNQLVWRDVNIRSPGNPARAQC